MEFSSLWQKGGIFNHVRKVEFSALWEKGGIINHVREWWDFQPRDRKVGFSTLWQKGGIFKRERNLYALKRQIHFRNTPMAGGAARGHLSVPQGLLLEGSCFPYLISLYSSFVLVLPWGSPRNLDVWGRKASCQNSGWGSRWLWAVRNRNKTFQFYG